MSPLSQGLETIAEMGGEEFQEPEGGRTQGKQCLLGRRGRTTVLTLTVAAVTCTKLSPSKL